MKRLLLSLSFVLSALNLCFAAKAYTGSITVTQSDGTQLRVMLHGDEHCNWLTTEDGALLTQVGNNYYIAQTTEQGELKATSFLAHNASARKSLEAEAVKSQNMGLFQKYINTQVNASSALSAKQKASNTSNYFPHTGSPRALVILVQFTDTVFQSSEKANSVFKHFLNAKKGDALPDGYEYYTGSTVKQNYQNQGSVAQYFSDMSNGQFTPQFDVVGPYTLSKASSYYGAGQNDKPVTLIKEACEAAVNAGVDLAPYDNDGDGNVDVIYVIYAGYPASMSGNVEDIWPKSGYSAGIYTTSDGKLKVNRYGLHSELNWGWYRNQVYGYLLSGIGLFCHEFSHCMGLPDTYPTKTAAQVDNQNPEMWDVMDGGEYTYNGGYAPTPYNPWEMDQFGWETPIELGTTAQQISLKSYTSERKALKIQAENNEYLLLQNIQKDGWYEKLCNKYATGLLVWRISITRDNLSTECPNNVVGKPGISIVPADGYIISDYQTGDGCKWTKDQYNESLCHDLFPTIVDETTINKLDTVVLNNTTLTDLLFNIKEENEVITFDYLKDQSTGIVHPIVDVNNEGDKKIYTLDGKYAGTDINCLPKGIYIIDKKKIIK